MPKRPLAPPPGLDTRCSSCTGFTYYSSALKRLEEKPVCIGLKSNSETLPTPFEAPEEIQTAAEEQLEKEGGDMYYVCVGTSIMTPQMMDQRGFPFCMSGVLWTFASKRMSEKTTPHSGAGAEADAAEGNRQPSRFPGVWAQKDDVMGQPAKGVAQNGQGGGQGNGQGGATPHDEAAREAAQKETERGMVPAFPAFPAIPELPFDQEAVVEEARKRAEAVVAFWKNFPEKFVAFNGKLVRSMQRTVEKTAAFGQKMVMYWVPGGREPQD